MTTNQLQWTRSGRELSAYLLSCRSKPVAVVSVLPGAPALRIDADHIARTLGEDAEVIVVTSGKTTYELRDALPHGTSLFGSAARVYSPERRWARDPHGSVLRVAHSPADARYIANQIIGDVLNKVPAPATPAAPAHRAPATREGTIEAIIAGGTRAMARLQDGTPALVRQEDTLPCIPLEWLYHPGQPVTGTFEETTGVLDVSGALTIPGADQAYTTGSVIWCLVQKASPDEAILALLPGDTITVNRQDISSNPMDQVDTLLVEGDIVAARLCLIEGTRRLRLADIDDAEPVLPAPAVTLHGRPWLMPGRTLVQPPAPSPAGPLPPTQKQIPAPGAPGAAGQPTQAATPSKALRDTQLQLEHARSQVRSLEEILVTIAAKQDDTCQLRKALDEASNETVRLRHRLGASHRIIRQQKERLKTRQRQEHHTHQAEEQANLFTDKEEQLRHDIYTAWAHRIPAPDKPSFPLHRYTLGRRFIESFDAHTPRMRAKALKALVDLLTGRAKTMPARAIHVLRTGTAATEPAVTRNADGAVCWRMAVEKGTAAARRIHYWEIPGGTIELHDLVTHETHVT